MVLPSVDAFTKILRDLLLEVSDVGIQGGLAQPLEKNFLGDRIGRIGEASGRSISPTLQAQHAAIETASRNILYDLTVSRLRSRSHQCH